MANIDLFVLTGSIAIKGDDAASRTITIGQQVTNSDVLVVDTATCVLTSGGALTLGSTIAAAGGTLTVGASGAIDCLALSQSDVSENFIDFISTEAASAVNPLSSLTVPGPPSGSARIAINGSPEWIQRTGPPADPALTLGVAATTFAAATQFMVITGDGGGNTVGTITGGVAGMRLTLLFVDTNVTITDTDAATADTVDLSAAFTSAADTVLELVHNGNKWFEVSRSVN